MWLYELETPSSWPAALASVLGVLAALWLLCEVFGFSGSLARGAILLGLSISIVGGIALALRVLGWSVLFLAVKSYVRERFANKVSRDTILVGIGPGGAIAVGMVSKAVREIRGFSPSVLVFDMAWTGTGNPPDIGRLFPPDFTLDSSRVWIIQGDIRTGSSLRKFQDLYHLESAKVFAFVASKDYLFRNRISDYMTTGSRKILPWPTEQ